MKRVIEIDEEIYKQISESITDSNRYITVSTTHKLSIAKSIYESTSLNEVLDKMSEKVQKIRAPRCTYAGNDYFRGREDTVNRVLDIINQYKESEEV